MNRGTRLRDYGGLHLNEGFQAEIAGLLEFEIQAATEIQL